jgi:hypothetical protein
MEKSLGIIIALLAGALLFYYLMKWQKQRENEARFSVPVDSYGVPVEPNNQQFYEAMAEITSIT